MKGFWFVLSLLFFSSNVFAGQNECLYLLVEGGASFAQRIKLDPPLPWDPAPEGYNNKFRNSEVLGLGLGYHFCPLFSGELLLDHRNSFKYEKTQSSPVAAGNKIRFFNFKNTTIMANLLAHGRGVSENLAYETNDLIIDPFVNLGIGVAYNTVDNFHSLQLFGGKVFSMMSPYTKTNVAYQFGFGVDMMSCDFLSVGLAYRYLAAGRLRSNDYVTDNADSPNTTSGRPAPPWSGRFKTNELFVRLKIFLN